MREAENCLQFFNEVMEKLEGWQDCKLKSWEFTSSSVHGFTSSRPES